MASYSDVGARELWRQFRQWQKAGNRAVTCEDGHGACGCSAEPSQSGKAPCSREVERELIWKQAADSDSEADQLRRYRERVEC